jgi:anti-anti-sigma regulatory factor
VLRITCTTNNEGATVKVEGRVADRWVDELARVAAAALGKTPRVLFDMSDVTFVDLRGAALLRALHQRGVELVACSAFVQTLLSGGPDGSIE